MDSNEQLLGKELIPAKCPATTAAKGPGITRRASSHEPSQVERLWPWILSGAVRMVGADAPFDAPILPGPTQSDSFMAANGCQIRKSLPTDLDFARFSA